jgi:DNA polymerase-1
MLLKMMDLLKGNQVIVFFDSGTLTFRHHLFPDYKSNRLSPPDDLKPQFSLCQKLCHEIELTVIQQEGVEADDLIASYTNQAKHHHMDVMIISSDKDLMQLIDSQVTLYDPIKNKPITQDDVMKKFGVLPNQVTGVQALLGDASDHIPGVKGIGMKGASQLMTTFGSFDQLMKNIQNIPNKRLRELIELQQDKAYLSYELATLKHDIDLPIRMNDLQIFVPNLQRLQIFLKEMGFKTLIQETPVNHSQFFSHSTVTSFDHLEEFISKIMVSKQCSFQCQTASLLPCDDQIIGVSLSTFDKEKIISVYVPIIRCPDLLNLIVDLLNNPTIQKIGHNIKNDLTILRHHLHTFEGFQDMMVVSYVLHAGLHGHDNDELALKYLGYHCQNIKALTKGRSFLELTLEDAALYACENSSISLRLFTDFYKELTPNLKDLYDNVECPLIPVIMRMEQEGIYVNHINLKLLKRDIDDDLGRIESDIYNQCGQVFLLSSPKQLGCILFEKMGIGQGKKTKMGAYKTDSLSLEAYQPHPLIDMILKWRELFKLKTTYIDGLLKRTSPMTKRVHTNFCVAGTATGRLSSSDPNLQNIPVKSDMGRRIRGCFEAKEGCVFASLDYSQIELRLLTHMASIPNLEHAFANGIDIHQKCASDIFKCTINDVTPEQRRFAKTINFGIIYGISPYGLSRQLSITTQEAKHMIDEYLMQYPGIQQYIDQQISFAKSHGYVETILRRRCYTPYILDKNHQLSQFSQRQAVNSPLQGSAADIMKMAMITINEFLKERHLHTKMLLQIHDELIFEIPNDETWVMDHLRSIMERVIDLRVPLIVVTHVSKQWE